MRHEIVLAEPNLFHSPEGDVLDSGTGRAFSESMSRGDTLRIRRTVRQMTNAELDAHVDAIAAGTNQPL